jgi:hypothetical protein
MNLKRLEVGHTETRIHRATPQGFYSKASRFAMPFRFAVP